MRRTLSLLKNHDSGASLVEFILVVPFMLAVVLATLEFGIAMHFWSLSTKGAQLASRQAVVVEPVATGVQNNGYAGDFGLFIGVPCTAPNGAANTDGNGASLCRTYSVTCTASGTWSALTGTCTTTGAAPAVTFNAAAMRALGQTVCSMLPLAVLDDCLFQPENLAVTYQTNGLGFVGRPGGLPLTVTVRMRCIVYPPQLFTFLAGWQPPPVGCGANPEAPGIRLHDAIATYTGEDLATN